MQNRITRVLAKERYTHEARVLSHVLELPRDVVSLVIEGSVQIPSHRSVILSPTLTDQRTFPDLLSRYSMHHYVRLQSMVNVPITHIGVRLWLDKLEIEYLLS